MWLTLVSHTESHIEAPNDSDPVYDDKIKSTVETTIVCVWGKK